jgi:hypothetical protein
MTIRPPYAAAAAALFLIEVIIAVFVDDAVVRPFVGDGLAVILVYCALRAMTPLAGGMALALALATAFAVEFGQLFGVLDMLGLRGNPVARIVLGTGFDPMDFVAYAAGASCVVAVGAMSSFWLQHRRPRPAP